MEPGPWGALPVLALASGGFGALTRRGYLQSDSGLGFFLSVALPSSQHEAFVVGEQRAERRAFPNLPLLEFHWLDPPPPGPHFREGDGNDGCLCVREGAERHTQ